VSSTEIRFASLNDVNSKTFASGRTETAGVTSSGR